MAQYEYCIRKIIISVFTKAKVLRIKVVDKTDNEL